jgi:multidrug efflux system membrane fusion protein
MKRSSFLSLLLVVLVVIWMASGKLNGSAGKTPEVESPAPAIPVMRVSVRELAADTVVREISVQGQLEPRRRISIRAETDGLVERLPVEKGARVRAGDLLVKLAEADRRAQIARARAEVVSQELAVSGHLELKKKGLQAETQLKTAEADLARARAELERLRLDLERTGIPAPFDGVLEKREVEQGSLVERGDRIGELVDKDTLLAVGHVPQQSAGRLHLGQHLTIRLLDGREAQAELTYLASVAEAGTRSFRVEARIANPDGELPAGVSAELRIQVGEEKAHFISPSVLTLDDKGRVGVKSVDATGRVVFHPVSMVKTQADGVWVAGLPDRIRVIDQGQGFVAEGETVEAVPSRPQDQS